MSNEWLEILKAAFEEIGLRLQEAFENIRRLFEETTAQDEAQAFYRRGVWDCYRCRGCGRWFSSEAEAHRCEAGHRAVSERARRRGRGADCRCAGRRAGARAREAKMRSTELRRIRGA